MMDNFNHYGRASPHDFQNRNNVFSNVGKAISNQGYELPQGSKPMLNRIGSNNVFDTSLNQHTFPTNSSPQHKSNGSLQDNMGRDEYQRYLRDKLTQIRTHKPDSRGPSYSYSPEKFQEKILNAERYQRGLMNPAANNPYQDYAQRPIETPNRFNSYPQQISSSPLLPYINAPSNVSPYNQFNGYPQQNGQGQGGYLPPIPGGGNSELKSTFERQTKLLEKISKAVGKDRYEGSRTKNIEPSNHELDERFSMFERAMEMKMRLMNQNNNIARMNQNQNQDRDQNYYQYYNQSRNQNQPKREYVEDNAFTFNQNIPMPIKEETPSEFKDYMINFQGYLLSHLSAANQLMQYQYQQQQQLYQQYQQQYQPFMFANYGYGDEEIPHSHSHRSKKKTKKSSGSKKSPREPSPQTPSSQQPKQSQSHSKTKSKKGSGGDGAPRKASVTGQRNPSLKIQNTTLYTDPKVSRQGSVAGDPQERAKLALRNLRKIMWTIAYPQVVKKDVAKRVQDRKDALMKKLLDSGEPAEKSLAVWVLNLVDKPVRGFVNEKKSYDFVGSPETGFPSNSDMKERSTKIKHLTTSIIDSFAFGMVSSPISDDGLAFLASMALEGRYALDKTLFNYELMRMNFNGYGRYLGMSQEQSCMILTCLLIVRLLIFELLLSAKRWNDTVEWTDQLQLNVKILASVIYRLTLSVMNDKLFVINLSPSHLPILARPPEKLNEKNQDPIDPDEAEMILDLFEEEQLHLIFSNSQWVGSTKETLRKSIQSIYQKIVEYRQQQPPANSG